MSVAIKVENLSKAYRIGQIGTGTISQDIERWWITKVMRREDPFLKLGETNDRTKKSESNVVWSLKDINFEIEQGDAVGIIGRNGAGKSTLLKILSRVTAPTTGSVKIKGRVASLLEVGTGFHPELTGRENIYLNGSILGMRKREIDRKLDEIIDFSGVERYIDTPVKRYSSGMSVRLAFAVAAHLESEILIVDEVLAVGDLDFQKKCLGKMEEVGFREGRTVLFVSHNLSNIRQLCRRGFLFVSGSLADCGNVASVLDKYSSATVETGTSNYVEQVHLERTSLIAGEELRMTIVLKNPSLLRNKTLVLRIRDDRNLNIIRLEIVTPKHAVQQVHVQTDPLYLIQGNYFIDLGVMDNRDTTTFEKFREVNMFTLIGIDIYGVGRIYNNSKAIVTPRVDCRFEPAR